MDHCLIRYNKLTSYVIDSVEEIVQKSLYKVSNEDGSRFYTVSLGNDDEVGSCDCMDFKRNKDLCKHFLALFESRQCDFTDLSSKYRNNPINTLDSHLFGDLLSTFRDEASSSLFYNEKTSNNDTTVENKIGE